MTPRSIRRAAERKAKKQARKAGYAADKNPPAQAPPVAEPVLTDPSFVEASDIVAPDFSPISPAQLAANRANAQHSTGPRTQAGRARSSQNAVKTALTGRTVLLPSDDVDEYAAFVARFERDLAPVGEAECELVESIANTHWRLRRIQALEFALYAHGHEQFEDAFAEYPEAMRYNRILLQTNLTYEKQFRNYNIQEARLDRKRAKDMAELHRLQAGRKANETAETLDRTATVRERPSKEDNDPELQAMLARRDEILAGLRAEWRQQPLPDPENGFDFSTDDFEALSGSLETPDSSESPLPFES